MSFENTHLWAADVVKEQITVAVLRKLIINNIDYYNFGAVFPDTFSYNRNRKIRGISSFIHGNTEVLTNGLVFDMLDQIGHTRDKKTWPLLVVFMPT